MKGLRAAVIAVLLGAGFTWGVLRLLGVEFSAGEFYPEYSSLRGDPQGTKLLYDSLSRLPGLTVARNYLPLDYFAGSPAAVLLFGLSRASLDQEFLQRAETLARRGNGVIAALAFQRRDTLPTDPGPLQHAWHVRLATDPDPSHQHPLFFAAADGWDARERAGDKILAIERVFGAGSVFLHAESGAFSNESLIDGDRLASVSDAIGPNSRVVFDEEHFGIAESGSVVGLARRFRLIGVACGMAIVLALALWKNISAFPPPRAAAPPESLTGRTSFEGLVTLLRRHVPSRDVASACWGEWLKANRHEIPPEQAAQTAARAAAAGHRPLEAVREIQERVGGIPIFSRGEL